MTLSTFLYIVGGVLAIYIIISVASTRKFTTADAIALLGIVVTIILALRVASPSSFTQQTDNLSRTPTLVYTSTEATNWIVTFEYRFPPGSWSRGTHQYSFVFTCPSDVQDNNGTITNNFSVSDSFPSSPTEIYLRWGGVRTSKLPDSSAADGVNPLQTTVAVLTWYDITQSEAERVAAACNATVSWDGGEPKPLISQQPFQN